jgi:hypothetical protein
MERTDVYRAYFTEESKYYADKLEKFENGKKISFNFWAAVLGIYWFCYRRMYVEAFLLYILAALFGLVVGYCLPRYSTGLNGHELYLRLIPWAFTFFFTGFLGTAIYILKSKRVVEPFISTWGLENIDDTKVYELREVGGTSWNDALVCVGISVALNLALKYIA